MERVALVRGVGSWEIRFEGGDDWELGPLPELLSCGDLG